MHSQCPPPPSMYRHSPPFCSQLDDKISLEMNEDLPRLRVETLEGATAAAATIDLGNHDEV